MKYSEWKEENRLERIKAKEVWKKIEGYSTYEVSSLGRIKSLPKQRTGKNGTYLTKEIIMKMSTDKDGYLKVGIKSDATWKQESKIVHRLVAIAFIPNPENKPEVNHKFGIKKDNRPSELEWCTSSENSLHSFRNGLQKPVSGESHGASKLTEKAVLEIRASNLSRKELSKKYNVNEQCISKVITRQRWKHI